RPVGDSAGKFQKGVFADRGVVPAFEAWRGGAEHDARVRRLRAYNGDISAAIAGRFLLFVARIVLFIHDDQTGASDRGKDARTRSDHDLRSACPNAPPLICALRVTECAVQNCGAVAETR